MRYYLFRDLDNESNLSEGKTYHAAGYVEEMYCELGKPTESGKDVVVVFFEPFEGTINRSWRTLDELELFDVSECEYNELVKYYDAIKKINL